MLRALYHSIMKAKWIILVLLLIAIAVSLRHFIKLDAVVAPLQEPVAAEAPIAQTPETNTVEEAVAVQVPVQPVEERNDAMLSEIDMLQGMPFDQAITMPFE